MIGAAVDAAWRTILILRLTHAEPANETVRNDLELGLLVKFALEAA